MSARRAPTVSTSARSSCTCSWPPKSSGSGAVRSRDVGIPDVGIPGRICPKSGVGAGKARSRAAKMTRLIAADCVAAVAKAAAGLLSGLSFAGTANDIKDCSLHEGDSCPCGHGAVTNRVSPSPISPLPQRRAGPRQLASQEACRLRPPWLAEDFPVIALRGRVGRSRAVKTNRCE